MTSDSGQTLEGTASLGGDAVAAAEEPLHRAAGRYLLIELLGRGATAEVWDAYDRDLDRRVALKLLGAARAGAGSALLDEAKAMAQLRHPSVVTVYDAGTLGGHPFVAMELVRGQTLRGWLDGGPRPWRDVVRVFLEAGRGLAAAHAAGIVHRDFKPTNVLLDEHGAARVADFGLALRARPGDEGAGRGGFAGTPAYMAPEQHDGEPAGPASDQFAFCVALFEALHGARPFAGATIAELDEAKHAQAIRPVAAAGVPAWLRALAVRGLAADPAARHPSMEALLLALGRDRRRPWRVAATVSAVALALGFAGWRISRDPAAAACAALGARLDDAWDPARRDAVRARFLATGMRYATDAADGAARELEGYRRALAAAQVAACRAPVPSDERALRQACLADRESELRALVHVFAEADRGVVQNAVRAAQGLSQIAACDHAAVGMAPPGPQEPSLRAGIEAVRARLAAARARRLAGKAKEGLAEAEALVDEARRLGYRPLVAEALLGLGQYRQDGGDLRGAEAAQTESYVAALAERHDPIAAAAAIDLTANVGRMQQRPADGLRWGELARAMLARMGGDLALESRLELALGLVSYAAGQLADAEAHDLRAQTLNERLRGTDTLNGVAIANALGNVAIERGHLNAADAHYAQAMDITTRVLGPMHPSYALLAANRASVSSQRGAAEEALRWAERGYQVAVAAIGPTSPQAAMLLGNLAVHENHLDRRPEAEAHARQALAVLEPAWGPDHPEVIRARGALADSLANRGRLDEAKALYTRIAAGAERAGMEGVQALGGLANLELVTGDLAAAERDLDRALELCRHSPEAMPLAAGLLARRTGVRLAKGDARGALRDGSLVLALTAGGGWDGDQATTRTNVGRAYLALGDAPAAVAILDANVAALPGAGFLRVAAEARFALAEALVTAGGDLARARALAQAARATLGKPVDDWLARHPLR